MKVPKPRKLPSGTWRIQLRLSGESVSITAKTEKECTRQAAMVKAEYQMGKRIAQSEEKTVTLSQAIDHYIQVRSESLSQSTVRGYRTIQRNRFKSIMDLPITENRDWQALVNEEAKHLAPKTVDNDYSFIRSVMRDYKIYLPKLTMPQIINNPRPYLEHEEILRFLDIIYGEPCEMAVLLGLHSLRRSEIMALEKPKSISGDIIKVRGAKVFDEHNKPVLKKTNKNSTSARDVRIQIPRLKELIDAAPDGPLVRTNINTPYNQVRSLCEKNGFENVGMHGLRHSFASLAHHLRMTEKETAEIGGWKDRNTMHKIYEHLDTADRLKAENKMADFYKNAK